MPAVMLDWFGRTLSRFVDGDADKNSSPLRAIKRVSVVTSHGSTRFRNRLQGQPGRHTITGVVLPMCAPGATLEWLAFYKIDRATEAARAKFVEGIGNHFGERAAATTA
jgi:putative NADPH-quinone reductase